MPRIPVYEQTTSPSGLVQGGKLTSAYAPSPVGKAISQLGQVGEQFVKAFDHQDALVAEENLNKLREEQSRLALDEKDGYLNKRGKDAIERDKDGKTLQEQYIARFDGYKQQLTAGMTDNQRIKFEQKSRLLDLDLKQSVLKHTINEADKYAEDVFKNGIKTEQDLVGRDYNNAVAFKVSLERITQNVNAYADRKGLSDDQRNNLLREQTASLHGSVLTGALAKTDLRFADTYLKSVEKDLSPEDNLKFKHVLTQEKKRIEAETKDWAEGSIWQMALSDKKDLEIMNSAAFKSLPIKEQFKVQADLYNFRNVRAKITPEIFKQVDDLANDPQKLRALKENEVYALTPRFGADNVEMLLKIRNKAPEQANIDADLFKTIANEYNIILPDKRVEAKARIERMVSDVVYERGGKKLSPEETEKIIRRALVDVTIVGKGLFGQDTPVNKPLYQLLGTGQEFKLAIPAADRNKIVDNFKLMGIKPTERQIANAWATAQAQDKQKKQALIWRKKTLNQQ